MVDIEAEAQLVALIVVRPGAKLLVASSIGKGFAVEMEAILAETRKGKQVVNLKAPAKLVVAREIAAEDDHVAVVGDNRKLVVFALDEVPVMARGQGVTLQRYRDGGLSDATSFKLDDGLSWTMGGESGRTRTETEISMWKVARGAAGRLPPQGFPRDNRF
jgi:topoisomerase-4 subunit A